jgi:hypothetical protein
MPVQKDRLIRKTNFTTITNNVIDGLQHDLRLLGLYVYLYKKPEIWDFHKTVIQKDCNVGEKLLNRLLKDLENYGLIEVKQMRKNSGQFIHNYIHILDGNSFKINPYVKSRRTVTGRTVKQSYKER